MLQCAMTMRSVNANHAQFAFKTSPIAVNISAWAGHLSHAVCTIRALNIHCHIGIRKTSRWMTEPRLTGADVAAAKEVSLVLGQVVLQLLELCQQPLLFALLAFPISGQILNESCGKQLLATAPHMCCLGQLLPAFFCKSSHLPCQISATSPLLTSKLQLMS